MTAPVCPGRRGMCEWNRKITEELSAEEAEQFAAILDKVAKKAREFAERGGKE